MAVSLPTFTPIFLPITLLLALHPTATAATSPCIEQACSEPRLGSKPECERLLQSHLTINSTQDLYNLSIAIISLGISKLAAARTYTDQALNGTKYSVGTAPRRALINCGVSYASALVSFNSSLAEVRDDGDYEGATYDLEVAATDSMAPCLDEVKSRNIDDAEIERANEVAVICGFSAFQAVSLIGLNSASPLP